MDLALAAYLLANLSILPATIVQLLTVMLAEIAFVLSVFLAISVTVLYSMYICKSFVVV